LETNDILKTIVFLIYYYPDPYDPHCSPDCPDAGWFRSSRHRPRAADALQTLQQFNAVVLTNAKSDSHIDGRTCIGGSLTGNNSPVFDMHPNDVPASNYAGLTVMGMAAPAPTRSAMRK
jgi:hypothetical protein